ncbi:hypothetical protein S7711_11050 [Stachybotrys chartarum IBT 7711]|uniref:Uncharacterized protein n=1 Tax=Stachybotrys chartarum (strain CBS 109288 / IBT 7711) TaxID=1280523 RepID=A0A084B2K0_STACB|nr:hypothetical protein S7711_11050 [Stachybotrys chartarum IBT 7711]
MSATLTTASDPSTLASAPGGPVFGAFPDHIFSAASATSIFPSYVAVVAAFWYSSMKKDPVESRLTSGTIALPAFNANENIIVAQKTSLAQHGAGVIEASNLSPLDEAPNSGVLWSRKNVLQGPRDEDLSVPYHGIKDSVSNCYKEWKGGIESGFWSQLNVPDCPQLLGNDMKIDSLFG